jgi:hypothetical protein
MGNYIQPGTENPTPNARVGIKPTPNGNPMGVSADGAKTENYVQPDFRPVTVDSRVGIVPMRFGRVLVEGDK